MAFLGAMGVLQFAFASNGILGMLFLRRLPRASAALGVAFVLAAFVWFFANGPRNVPDTGAGLDGNDQARWFATAAAAAFAVTALASSAINDRWGAKAPGEGVGLDALRHTTFARALARRVARMRIWRGM